MTERDVTELLNSGADLVRWFSARTSFTGFEKVPQPGSPFDSQALMFFTEAAINLASKRLGVAPDEFVSEVIASRNDAM